MVDRNPLGQSQDPQRLVSNVTPVAITPAQYGVDTSLATGMAKANQVLLQAMNVGTSVANNKQKDNEALLKDQGTAIAIAKKDILAPQLDDSAKAIDLETQHQTELEKKITKDSVVTNEGLTPLTKSGLFKQKQDIESLKDSKFILKGLQDKQEQLRAANEYVPKGNAAAKAYYDTRAISDLGNASLNLQAAIDANPMMTPEQVESLTQSIKSRYAKMYLQSGATDAAAYFSKGFDTVANDIKRTSYLQAIAQVKDNTLIANELQTQKAFANTTSANPAQVVIPLSKPGVQPQSVTAVPPVDGSAKITGRFGDNRGDHSHKGIDLAIKAGSPVKVAVSGTVTKVGYDPGYGNFVFIKNVDGKETRYAHLESSNVQPGQKLGKGVVLGKVGSTGRSTGPHLHFEVRDGRGVAIDPISYINNLEIPIQSKTTAMVATGNAVVETVKTATPSNMQSLRNTAVVQGISNVFQIQGAKEGSKPALNLIDNLFKQAIDSGVSSERAYDILNQFIKTAEENVITANNKDPNSSDVSTAILTLRHLEKYKSDNAMTKFSTYQIAKDNRTVQLRDSNTAQNSARDFQFFSEYTTLVSGGTNPGIALAQVSSKLGQPSKAVMGQISLYQQGNNQARIQQDQQAGRDLATQSRAENLAIDEQKLLNTSSKKYVNNALGPDVKDAIGNSGTLTSDAGPTIRAIKTRAALLVDQKNYDGPTALKEAAKALGYIETKSKAQSPTTNSGGSNKASTSKSKTPISNSQRAAFGG
jgi:murein DD-endopeptidase MepM/ murein hydrolase activator NlpD